MLSILLAMAALPAAAPAAVPLDPGKLFVDACLDGAAKLAQGQAKAIPFDEIPLRLRGHFDRPASAQVWKLSAPRSGYLYLLSFDGTARYQKVCGVAADGADLDSTAAPLQQRLLGHTEPTTMEVTEYWKPEDGYMAMVTKAGGFAVLQTNWLSEKQRAQAMKRYGPDSD